MRERVPNPKPRPRKIGAQEDEERGEEPLNSKIQNPKIMNKGTPKRKEN